MMQLRLTHQPSVTLLMGVHNGAHYLEPQLASIASQSYENWQLICADDGSSDASVSLIRAFQRQHPHQVSCVSGPKLGFSANYLQMIANLPDNPGLVGLCDQDDIWMPDKIARGLQALPQVSDIPTLYCSRRWDWFPDTNKRIPTQPPARGCSFRNALVENVAFGNTILLNPAAAALARTAARRTDQVYAHDWWLYLLITGAGGNVVFDTGPPTILYRQHGDNAIGAGLGVTSSLRRKVGVLRGDYARRINSNLIALAQVSDLLTQTNRTYLQDFAAARRAALVPRIRTLRRVGAYRQSWQGNLGFWGAAGLGQI